MYAQIAFFFLAALAVISALFVVFHRNPVYNVLALVVTFFSIAGHYFLLNAQFLAAVHVIVYAGAIMVLFLYVIFMLNLDQDTEPYKPMALKVATVGAGLLLGTVLIGVLGTAQIDVTGANEFNRDDIGLVQTLGKVLYNEYMVPFEISAILFLGAMVGAVLIGKKEAK
jgi:NADH-quinone oxidoreductase subunit J